MGREVPAKLFGFMRETSRQAGADVAAAQAGLALRSVDTDAWGARVDWNEIAQFFERAHGHETDEWLEGFGELYVQVHAWQQMIARLAMTPRLMYELCMGPLARASFPHMDFAVEPHAAGIRLEMVLPDRFVGSRVYFRATVGEIRKMTTILGRPPARVEAEVSAHHGVYEIELDEPMTALDHARSLAARSYDFVLSQAVLLMRDAVSAGRVDDESSNIIDLQKRFGLTRAEARVTARLVDGLTVTEIADALGTRVSTIRTHLKHAFSKTTTRGQSDLVRLVITGGVPRD